MQIKKTFIENICGITSESVDIIDIDEDSLFEAVTTHQLETVTYLRNLAENLGKQYLHLSKLLPNRSGFNTDGVGWKIENEKITHINTEYNITIFELT